ncbi:MAG: glycosyltransferase WbuB [Sulfuricella sp.]|nr:glycosyltransferase WbuB [Sulfuricella sp.]
MRILVYGINYVPELTGIGKYSGEMAEWLSRQGHEVHVVTAPPYYPAWRVEHGYSPWFYRSPSPQPGRPGVRVYRCPLWVPARPSGLKRLVHLASFALSSLPVMLLHAFWRPQVVLVVEPPLMCAPAALLISKLCRAKSWLHIQDFEVDAAFDLGILPSGFLRRRILSFERFLMRRFDRVSTISPNMLDRLPGKGVSPAKAILFPNWVDTQSVFPLDRPAPMRAELGISADATVALYSGNMGEKQGLEIVLEAARRLAPEESLRFVLCGDGAARARLQKVYAHLPNVLWLPLQPMEKLNDLLNVADVHLLPQRGDAADLVMPSKLTGMLASGRPVIATARRETRLAEVVSKCGIAVSPGDVDEFCRALLRLAKAHGDRLALGAAARAYAETHMGKGSILGTFEKNLSALVHGSAEPDVCDAVRGVR